MQLAPWNKYNTWFEQGKYIFSSWLSRNGFIIVIITLLNFREAKFQLFNELVSRILCKTAFFTRGDIFQDTFHRTQELVMPSHKKLGKEGRKSAWVSQTKRQEGHAEAVEADTDIWEEYRESDYVGVGWGRPGAIWSWTWQGMLRITTRVSTGMLLWQEKSQKVYTHILLWEMQGWQTEVNEKAEVLNIFFACLQWQTTSLPTPFDRTGVAKCFPL